MFSEPCFEGYCEYWHCAVSQISSEFFTALRNSCIYICLHVLCSQFPTVLFPFPKSAVSPCTFCSPGLQMQMEQDSQLPHSLKTGAQNLMPLPFSQADCIEQLVWLKFFIKNCFEKSTQNEITKQGETKLINILVLLC